MEKVHDSTQETIGPRKFTRSRSVGISLGEFLSVGFQSSTCTCWKRRSKAASFSMYFLKLIKPVIFVVVVFSTNSGRNGETHPQRRRSKVVI